MDRSARAPPTRGLPGTDAARRVHPEATGFDRVAAAYERSRPGYPTAALDHLVAEMPLRRGSRLVDLAAGTGKLSRALLPTGATLVAVEPSRAMREEFARQLPGVEVVDGTAEAIPLPDGSADGVVVGQAFHWFDADRALVEIARVLRPGGGLGLLWNLRDDERSSFSRGLTAILDPLDPGAPRGRSGRWKPAFERSEAFDPPRRTVFPNLQRLDRAAAVERALSVSFVARLDAAGRARVAAAVERLLDADPETRDGGRVDLPYRTQVYVTHRRP